jgi:anti-anti-sigma factor
MTDNGWHRVAARLSIRVSTHEASVLVQVRGEIDIANADAFAAAIRPVVSDRSFGRALIGLDQLDFLGVAGAYALRGIADSLSTSGQRLVLLNPSRLPRLVLDVAGLSDLVRPHGSGPCGFAGRAPEDAAVA